MDFTDILYWMSTVTVREKFIRFLQSDVISNIHAVPIIVLETI